MHMRSKLLKIFLIVTQDFIHSFINFHTRFFSVEGRSGSSLRKTRITPRSAEISDDTAGSIPRRRQTRSEIQQRHLVISRSLGSFSQGVASRTCLDNPFCVILVTLRNHRSCERSCDRFGLEVAPHSRLYEFHSRTFCHQVSRRELIAKFKNWQHFDACKSPFCD